MNGTINDYAVYDYESMYKAFYIMKKNNKGVFVVDKDENYIGLMTQNDFDKITYDEDEKSVGEICNRKSKTISDDMDTYAEARRIFSETDITILPIVSQTGKLVDYFTRERAFYRHYYKEQKLPRMHYAYNIWSAANEAKRLGIPAISVIEFGVAGGSGIVNCEFHAREISRLTNVDIQIYGFDRIDGMPTENEGYKDLIHLWPAGAFKMNKEVLIKRINSAKIIFGEMKDTIPRFITEFKPAPIGVMLVDCDYYSSAKDVLKILDYDDKFFMPRIYMYFDDVLPFYEMQGENLAIREFNKEKSNMNISPETCQIDKYSIWSDKKMRLKICHRFSHPLYNENAANVNLHIYKNEV